MQGRADRGRGLQWGQQLRSRGEGLGGDGGAGRLGGDGRLDEDSGAAQGRGPVDGFDRKSREEAEGGDVGLVNTGLLFRLRWVS